MPMPAVSLAAVPGKRARALEMAVEIERRGFTRSDFLTFHPGGRLGAQLATVAQLMARGENVPMVRAGATLLDATFEMSRKRYG